MLLENNTWTVQEKNLPPWIQEAVAQFHPAIRNRKFNSVYSIGLFITRRIGSGLIRLCSPDTNFPDSDMNKYRLEAFSDGVIAIIITIMVLEIKTPHDTSWMALTEQLPVFLSYLLSFIYIGIYWGNHHHLISVLSHVNAAIIWSNMNLLFWLSLIPFATGWMGENHFAQNTVVLYAIFTAGLRYFFYHTADLC